VKKNFISILDVIEQRFKIHIEYIDLHRDQGCPVPPVSSCIMRERRRRQTSPAATRM
jgi:hypothetical protein